MDRGRHGALLSSLLLAGVIAVAGWLAGAGTLCAQGNVSPAPSVAVPPPAPTASLTPDVARKRAAEKAMVERRQRDLGAGAQEAQKRIEELPPEEREAFKRNLRVWGQLSPEEREVVRKEADERMRAEVEKAFQESGLHLDKDRREVFGLRYRQERRRLERELQEKLQAERARRLPAIIDELRREFGDKPVGPPPPVTAPPPGSKATPSVSVPAASPFR